VRARSLRFPGPRSRKKSFLCVCMRTLRRARGADALVRCNAGLWNAVRGRDAANIPARTRAILRTGKGSRTSIKPSWAAAVSHRCGGRRSGKLRAKLITDRFAGTTGVRHGRLGESSLDFMLPPGIPYTFCTSNRDSKSRIVHKHDSKQRFDKCINAL